MNDIFNFKRFALSLRRLVVEKGIKMFGSIIIILFVILLFMNIKLDPAVYSQIQVIFMTLGLMFGPVLYMAVIANEFTNQSKGISYLLMPNSRFEKWLLNNVVVIALYYIIFGFLYRLMDMWMISRINAKFDLPADLIEPISFYSNFFIIPALVGSAIAIGILLGSYYFKKNSLVISLFIMFGFLVLAFTFDHLFASVLFDGQIPFGDSAPFVGVSVFDAISDRHYYVEPSLSAEAIVGWVFIPIIILLSLTYFVRIREKQL